MIIRQMQRRDCDAAIELTKAEGWPHTSEDWELHFRLGRGWAAFGDRGELVGTVLWWPYGDTTGTLGLVVVSQTARGKGIGGRLIKAAMADASGRTLTLIATAAALRVYRKFGFVEKGFVLQYQGPVPDVNPINPPSGIHIRPVNPSDRDSIYRLDAEGFGACRRPLLDAVFGAEGYIAERDGHALGFALARPSGRGVVIGPIVANDQKLAKAMTSRILHSNTGFVRIDVPGYAKELALWLKELGIACVDQGTVMRRGYLPEKKTGTRIFSLVSQAFG